jgi:hypothetical protein
VAKHVLNAAQRANYSTPTYRTSAYKRAVLDQGHTHAFGSPNHQQQDSKPKGISMSDALYLARAPDYANTKTKAWNGETLWLVFKGAPWRR